MAKKLTALMIGIGLLSLSGTAYSATKWSSYTTITKLVPYRTQLGFVVEYSDPASTCEGGKRFMLDATSADYKTQAAVLTAAYLAKKRISFQFVTDTAVCAPLVYMFTTTD